MICELSQLLSPGRSRGSFLKPFSIRSVTSLHNPLKLLSAYSAPKLILGGIAARPRDGTAGVMSRALADRPGATVQFSVVGAFIPATATFPAVHLQFAPLIVSGSAEYRIVLSGQRQLRRGASHTPAAGQHF